jgi:putative acetyltransferase
VLIRREASQDAAAIHAVTAAAFSRPEGPEGPEGPSRDVPLEAPLIDWLRASPAWIPQLSMVATDPSGDVVGHVACTRATVGPAPVLALGPLSVRPDWQRQGVGKALVHAVLGAADALGEPLVGLLGSTGYYPRFGFRLAGEYGIRPRYAEWVPHFQVRALTAYDPAVRGGFAYSEPFDRL